MRHLCTSPNKEADIVQVYKNDLRSLLGVDVEFFNTEYLTTVLEALSKPSTDEEYVALTLEDFDGYYQSIANRTAMFYKVMKLLVAAEHNDTCAAHVATIQATIRAMEPVAELLFNARAGMYALLKNFGEHYSVTMQKVSLPVQEDLKALMPALAKLKDALAGLIRQDQRVTEALCGLCPVG